ncbi:hypothetical protein FOS14_22070 [Skermania sp. ID1734]|uniref:hypothetical protein n=1 Tax=Skermania sp. ID1734 TaxID=2597516 RepID=UPI0011801B50|nr:hypothetical protein [Skermania sp. ID1734]TSD93754.1 hypothetical protein FOS14_22070 [Skermania sp. ID1734]
MTPADPERRRWSRRYQARTGAAVVLLAVSLLAPILPVVGVLGAVALFSGGVVMARSATAARTQWRMLAAHSAAVTEHTELMRRAFDDARALYAALARDAVLYEQPPGVLILAPGERVQARFGAPVSLSGRGAVMTEVALTTRALVLILTDGSPVRWWWDAATGLRIDLPAERVDVYFAGGADSVHVHGPAAAIVAVYASYWLRPPAQFLCAPELAVLRAG